MSCGPWIYRKVDANVLRSLKREASKQQYVIPDSPSGKFRIQAAGMSLVFNYHWNPSNNIFKLTCIEKPALIRCSVIKSFADQMIAQCGGSN